MNNFFYQFIIQTKTVPTKFRNRYQLRVKTFVLFYNEKNKTNLTNMWLEKQSYITRTFVISSDRILVCSLITNDVSGQ